MWSRLTTSLVARTHHSTSLLERSTTLAGTKEVGSGYCNGRANDGLLFRVPDHAILAE